MFHTLMFHIACMPKFCLSLKQLPQAKTEVLPVVNGRNLLVFFDVVSRDFVSFDDGVELCHVVVVPHGVLQVTEPTLPQ